jgi:hypothetical protein
MNTKMKVYQAIVLPDITRGPDTVVGFPGALSGDWCGEHQDWPKVEGEKNAD